METDLILGASIFTGLGGVVLAFLGVALPVAMLADAYDRYNAPKGPRSAAMAVGALLTVAGAVAVIREFWLATDGQWATDAFIVSGLVALVALAYLAVRQQLVGGSEPYSNAQILGRMGTYAFLSVLALLILFPVWMVIIRALSTPRPYIDAGQPLRWIEPQWDVFQQAWSSGDFGGRFVVSAIATLIICSAQVLTSVLAAYAFAFLRFPFKKVIFALFMATLMLPIEVTLVPNIDTIRGLDWLNSYKALTLPFLATALGTFLIRQGFMGIPKDLLDASKLDGYGHTAFLFKVAIPLTKPVIASFTLISFLGAWNQYLWPRAITTENDMNTIQIALRTFIRSQPESLNVGVAGTILAAIPLLILLLFFQRQIVSGLTAGAVK